MDITSIILLAALIVMCCVALLGWGYAALNRRDNEHLKNELALSEKAGEYCHQREISLSNQLEGAIDVLQMVVHEYDKELATAHDSLTMVLEENAQISAEGWRPACWWRIVNPDGSLWCETSDEDEARSWVRDGDVLERLYKKPGTSKWEEIPVIQQGATA